MFAHARMFALAGATAIAMPALANAAVINNTLNADQFYSFAEVISSGETIEFRFTVLEDLMISGFSVSGTGTNTQVDLRNIRFGLLTPPTDEFSTVESFGLTAAGFGFIDGDTWDMGSVFSVYFTDGIVNDVGLTLSFGTEQVATIPLPATALLLAPFLLAGGIAGLRRRKSGPTTV